MNVLPPGPPRAGGLTDALRAVAATLGELAQVRGALFAVELREEVQRRKDMLVLAALGVALLHTAFLLLTVLVVALFWDSHRIAALGAVAGLYLAGGTAAFMRLRVNALANPDPFADTVRELGRDLATLRTQR